mgnify:CR=1 FL=1
MTRQAPKYHLPDDSDFSTIPVDIYQPWCKQCYLCVEFCPKDVFKILKSGKVEVAHPENCIQCEMCARHCPDYAILLKKRDVKKSRLDHP